MVVTHPIIHVSDIIYLWRNRKKTKENGKPLSMRAQKKIKVGWLEVPFYFPFERSFMLPILMWYLLAFGIIFSRDCVFFWELLSQDTIPFVNLL